MKKKILKHRKKGFTLTEILLVLGLGAMIIISVFMVYPKISANMRASQEAHNVTLIVAGVKVLYSSTPYYTGLTTTDAVNGNVFPDNVLSSSSTTPLNAWKGTITLSPGNEGPSGATDSSFSLTDPNIPTLECIHIVSEIQSDFYKVKINDTLVKDSTITYDPATVTTACNQTTKNTIEFVSF